jgi:hypothetical protein
MEPHYTTLNLNEVALLVAQARRDSYPNHSNKHPLLAGYKPVTGYAHE